MSFWLSPIIKPTKQGSYECTDGEFIYYAYWNGENWYHEKQIIEPLYWLEKKEAKEPLMKKYNL